MRDIPCLVTKHRLVNERVRSDLCQSPAFVTSWRKSTVSRGGAIARYRNDKVWFTRPLTLLGGSKLSSLFKKIRMSFVNDVERPEHHDAGHPNSVSRIEY